MKNKVVKYFCFAFCILLILSSVGCKGEDYDTDSSMNSFSQSVSINNNAGDSSDTCTDFSSTNETDGSNESNASAGINFSSINEILDSEEHTDNDDRNQSSSLHSYNSSENSSGSISDNSSASITETDPNYYDVLRPWYNIGHNKQLRGAPIIYAIFMDDDESSWDTASIEMFLSDEIDPAVRYLESEAKKWQVDLNLSVKSFATVLNQGYTFKYEGVVNRDLRQSPSTKDVLEKAAIDFGYSSEETLQEAISSLNGGKEIIFLCILNKDGTCYTRNQATNGSTTLVEETILFRRPLNHPEWFLKKGQRVSVIAHEILHLFGAEDFYLTSSRENLAEQYYPNDIMLWQYANISDNTLGDCVAYSIGWTNNTPQVCQKDEWWQ